jgi:hypothetical protein
VGRSPYQSEKRRKELARLKKQEEKRQRRFNKKHEGESPDAGAETGSPEGSLEPVAQEGRIESDPPASGQPDATPQGDPQPGSPS